jgi:hypothetical protein
MTTSNSGPDTGRRRTEGAGAAPDQEVGPAVQFRLVRYNPRRRARGVEAAEVEVIHPPDLDITYPEGEIVEFQVKERRWMSQSDIRANIREHGEHPELRRALKAYSDNVVWAREVAP